MLAVVAIHVVGVFAGSLLHRENLVGSMVTGRKTGPARDGIGTPRRVVAALLLTLVIGLWTGMVPTPGLTPAMTPVKVIVHSSADTGPYR